MKIWFPQSSQGTCIKLKPAWQNEQIHFNPQKSARSPQSSNTEIFPFFYQKKKLFSLRSFLFSFSSSTFILPFLPVCLLAVFFSLFIVILSSNHRHTFRSSGFFMANIHTVCAVYVRNNNDKNNINNNVVYVAWRSGMGRQCQWWKKFSFHSVLIRISLLHAYIYRESKWVRVRIGVSWYGKFMENFWPFRCCRE